MTEHRPAMKAGAGEPFRTPAVMLLFTCTAACAPAAPPPAPSPETSCIVADDAPRTRVTLGVTGTPDASAPAAGSRHIAAQLYETLIRVDCTGSLVSGLASTWSSADGLGWQFELAPGASFHDGTPVTAASVARAWANAGIPRLEEVAATGEYQLHVKLREPADARLFAHPSLSVARTGGGGWPAGTGVYVPAAGAGTLLLLDRADDAHAPDTIELRAVRGDARAAIDAGVDALVSGAADVVAYARARNDYSLAPLPWTRTYVLLTANGSAASPAAALDALARDAVRADARPASPPFWWTSCTAPDREPAVQATASGILYPRGDETARELAERIAALAWPSSRSPAWLRERLPSGYTLPRTAGVDSGAMSAALRAGTALAAIASVPRTPHEGCADAPALAAWPALPLIDTRDHLIHRAGVGRIHVDGYGTIRFGAR
ncbi:MAG TPA: ABC transporter substrate-binding protein [Longimicrobiales bacterium]